MEFSTQQISPERWGIYSGNRLLATVGCKATCETFMANLVSGRRDAPENDVDALYQAPTLRKETACKETACKETAYEETAYKETAAQESAAQESAAQESVAKTDELMVDSLLKAELGTQSLTVNELKAAVLRAQDSLPSGSGFRVNQDGRKKRKRTSDQDQIRSAS
jgi:hypothetical protein